MENEKLYAMRHSCEHVLTMAMLRLWSGKIKAAMGPATDEGFYFDFDSDIKISEDDFKQIEKEMAKIIKEDLPINKDEMTVVEAREFFNSNVYKGNEYKHEWLDQIESRDEKVSIYWMGEKGKDIPETFVDICAGPHVDSTSKIGVFKLLKIAGAYWHGDEKNKMLTRIYGTCFETKDQLSEYLKMMEEAEKRDHRKLGKDLDIYSFDDEVGPGLPLWHPNGTIIIEEIEKLAKEMERKYGYQRVQTPHIAKEELYLRSGHLPYYKDSMFPPMKLENETYYLKAMNCPHHHKIFGFHKRSYREMPVRLAEYGHCYRYEDSGSLFGLMRVRSMNMNDAHIYCSEEQFEEEFIKVLEMYKYYFELFGIEKYQMRLSKHDKEGLGKKYVDNEALWIKTEEQVRNALEKSGMPFVEVENEAAFYGPKIDVEIWSVIGREFTLATNQLDFAVPERFNLTYIDKDGKDKTPICIHRAPLSTHERLIGFLIEHYAGAFPIWLAPIQVQLVPVSEKHVEGAEKIRQELFDLGIRVGFDSADETVGNKIRKAAKLKIPYLVVVGDKELEGEDWMIRIRGQEEQVSMSKDKFVEKVLGEIKNRKSELIDILGV